MNNDKSNNKVALVTGAGTGIGRAVALAFLREGYSVVLAGRRIEPLSNVVKESGTDRALAVATDVSQPDSVNALFAKIKEVFGRLDVLVNNAGVGTPGVNFEDISFEQWQNAARAATFVQRGCRAAPRRRIASHFEQPVDGRAVAGRVHA